MQLKASEASKWPSGHSNIHARSRVEMLPVLVSEKVLQWQGRNCQGEAPWESV